MSPSNVFEVKLQVTRILISDWLKLRWSQAIHGIYVTVCKTSFALGR